MKKKINRVVAFVMGICLILTSVPLTTVNAEDAVTAYKNALTNGGFEEWEAEAMPNAWTVSSEIDGGTATVQENSTVLMLNKNAVDGNPAVIQDISGLTGSVLDGTNVTQAVKYIVKTKVMATDATALPVIDIRGEGKTSGADAAGNAYRKVINVNTQNNYTLVPGEWQEITAEYTAPSGLTKIELRLIDQVAGSVYWDDVRVYKSDDTTQANLLTNGDFEEALSGWRFFSSDTKYVLGTHYGTANTVVAGTKAVQMKGTQETSDIALSQTVSVAAGETNQFSAKLRNFAGSVPYMKVTYYDAEGNQAGEVQSVDCATVSAGAWTEVTGTCVVPNGTVSATITVGQTGTGICLWDNVQLSVPVTELSNGSFENIENGMPTDWSASGTGDADTIAVQDHGIVLMLNKTNEEGMGNPAVIQDISGLTGSVLDGTNVTQAVKYIVKTKVMVTDATALPVIDIRGEGKTSGADAAGNAYRKVINVNTQNNYTLVSGEWQEITAEYTAPSGLTKIELRLIDQVAGSVYWDDVRVYKSDDTTQANLLTNGDFEEALSGWRFFSSDTKYVLGTHYGTVNTASAGANAVLFTGTALESKVSLEQTVAVETGAEYTYYANVKTSDTSQGSPYLTVTHYDTNGAVVGEILSADCTAVNTGAWETVQATYIIPEGAVSAVISVGQSGIGTCLWDNVKFVNGTVSEDELKDPATIAAEFREMLAAEKESATPAIEEPWGEENVYEEPYAGQSNLVLNGDFELNTGSDSDVLEYWNLKEEFGDYVSIAEGEGYNGSDCVKFNVPEKNAQGENLQQNPYYNQWIKVVGGAEYQISYKYKLVCTGEAAYAKPTVKVECWTDQSLPGASHIAGFYAHGSIAEADGEWHTYTQKVYPAANVAEMEVLARSLAVGVNLGASTTLYLDDVEIVMTRPPKPLELVTDAIFYYSDVVAAQGENGTITTNINTGYFPQFANAKIDLEIKDPEGNQIWPEEGASKTFTSENGMVSTTFPLSILTLKEQRYEIIATLYDTDGTTVKQRKVQNIFVFDRPTSLSSDGIFTKDDGTIFYPEYAYHVSRATSSEYMKLKETGINLVQMGSFTSPDQALAALDAAETAGIMGFIALYNNMKPAGDNSNIDNTVAIIEAVKDHPALFGYGVMDEVFLNLIGPEDEMEASYRLIRSLDAKHPIMTMEAVSNYYDDCAKYVDILCIDPYATAASQSVAERTVQAIEAVNNEKPVYALLEAYRNTHGRFPTPNDLRNNIWQSLIMDANAIGYYSITDSEINDETGKNGIPIWDAKDGGALWQAIRDFNTYEKQIAYDHFVFDKSAVYTESVEIGDPYWYSSWKVDNPDGSQDYYMVVLSMLEDAEATQEVSIPLNKEGDAAYGRFNATALSGRITKDSADNVTGEIVAGKDSLEMTLQGWEAILFQIESAEALDVKLGMFDESGAVIDARTAEDEPVSPIGAGEYTVNEAVTVTAPITENYNFNGWYAAETDESGAVTGFTGDAVSADTEYTFTVTADTNLAAVYKALTVEEDTDGVADSYRIGTGGTAVVTADVAGLTGIEVDGTALDAANYSINAEAGEITFTNAFLDTLIAGKHTVKLVYTGGYTETVLTIVEALDVMEEKSDLSYKQGADGDTAEIYCNGEYGKFVSVEVDGAVVAAANYTVKEGSTVITFTEAYLESLAVGTHTVKLNYTDGSVESILNILAKEIVTEDAGTDDEKDTDADVTTSNNASVKEVSASDAETGDESNIFLWMIMLSATTLIGAFVVIHGKKIKK